MCFVIAGVQPKTKVLDQRPKRCPACGLHQAYSQRVDHYFSLFFIPLVRVKQGDPMLYCRRCQQAVGSHGPAKTSPPAESPAKMACRHCGGTITSSFQYCPQCGQKITE